MKTKRFMDCEYWGRPVPGFGDPKAQLLLVGLAPAAHGANRTGRMFTGDESGKWLFRALYKAGFANQPDSIQKDDGLSLTNSYITAACRCAPPDNKPLPDELIKCRRYILDEFLLLKDLRVVIGLGKTGFDTAFDCMRSLGWTERSSRPKFSHGVIEPITSNIILIGSYHPSQQNTFTGTLTEPMFNSIFRTAKRYL
ncbi:MAG: uracil-DNA glycosylase [Bacteroidota bacterium]